MNRIGSSRGFTLIELVMAGSITAIVALMGMQSMRSSSSKMSVEGLAMTVAEQLKSIRQDAVARRQPSALVLPSTGEACATSWFTLAGSVDPKVTGAQAQNGQLGTLQLFEGTWPTAGTFTKNAAMPGNKWSNFSVQKWLDSAPSQAAALEKDYCFVFLPDGTLRTNDLPVLDTDGNYHIVVAAGVDSTTTAALGGTNSMTTQPAYKKLSRSGDCWTISISPAGDVSVNGGLAFVSAGVTVSGQISSPIVSATAAKPPVEGDTDPEFIENSPIIFPATNPNNPPSDNAVNSTITAQQYVSLRSVALSHTGKQLHCTWKCDTPSTNKGTGQGTYSYATAMTGSVATAAGGIMEWDQAGNSGSGAYVCQWQWRPPIDAQPADTYDLYCEVSNYDSPKVKASIKNRVTIVPPGVILYETDRNDSGGRAGIWSMNPDGGSRKCYVAGATQPSADLHQTRVVFMRSGQIQMLSPSDPTHPLVLRDTGTLSAPSISPTGNRIAFRDGNNIMVANVAKNAPATVVVSVPVNINVYPWSNARPGTEKFTWSPDGNTMACCSGTDITKYTIANNGLGDPIVTGSSAAATATSQWPLWSPSWKADGSQIYYEINGVEGVYDPYLHLTRAGADWLEFSPLLEETLPERDPNIAAANEQMLEVVKPVTSPFAKVNVGENTNDDGQIYLVDVSGPSGLNMKAIKLTSDGTHSTRPVWCVR